MNKLEHKKNIIQKLIYYCSKDLEISLNTLKSSDGVLPKSTIQKMVEYCNERKIVIIGLNNRLIELIEFEEDVSE